MSQDPNQPVYNAPQANYAPAAGGDYPGKTLGIVGLVLAFVFSIAGLIVSAIALNQSKQAGVKNTPAKVGLILSIIFTVLGIIYIIGMVIVIAVAASNGMTTS